MQRKIYLRQTKNIVWVVKKANEDCFSFKSLKSIKIPLFLSNSAEENQTKQMKNKIEWNTNLLVFFLFIFSDHVHPTYLLCLNAITSNALKSGKILCMKIGQCLILILVLMVLFSTCEIIKLKWWWMDGDTNLLKGFWWNTFCSP